MRQDSIALGMSKSQFKFHPHYQQVLWPEANLQTFLRKIRGLGSMTFKLLFCSNILYSQCSFHQWRKYWTAKFSKQLESHCCCNDLYFISWWSQLKPLIWKNTKDIHGNLMVSNVVMCCQQWRYMQTEGLEKNKYKRGNLQNDGG